MPRKPRTADHCQYVSPLGRKCRQMRALGHPSFCQQHSGRPPQAPNEALTSQLLNQTEDFTSAAQVNQFLANLLKLTARGLIPRRDAAVLAYIAQSLLNGLAARRRELRDQQPLADHERTQIIWDMPRPSREDGPPPEVDEWSDRARYERLAGLRRSSYKGLPAQQADQGAVEGALAGSCGEPPAPP